VNESGLYTYWTTPESVQVIALSLDGKEKWTQDLGPFTGRHGSGASCVVLDQVVWVNNDQDGPSALLGLAAETGSIKYRLNRRADRVSYGTPCVLNREDGKSELIFAASSHGLTSIDPQTGTINWEATNVFPTRVVSSPITSGGLVICSCGEGGVGRRLVAVRPPAAKGQPALVYDLKSNVPNVPTPLAIDGLLYLLCDNGMLRCVRSATGEPVWQEKLTERFYSSPVYAGGRLYLTGKTGVVLVIAAGEKYQLLAQNSLGAASFATPAIAGSTIFFRTVSHLIAVGGKP
jgi:outer membrane protein assembly factor BamB